MAADGEDDEAIFKLAKWNLNVDNAEGKASRDTNMALTLGDCYFKGEGVAQNLDEAQKWYFYAAAQEHPEALFKLAEFLYNGYQFSAETRNQHYIQSAFLSTKKL